MRTAFSDVPQNFYTFRYCLIHLKNLWEASHKFFRDGKQFKGLTHCQARNEEAMSFAFNVSLSSVNVARAYAPKEGYNLSIGATKTLIHNAAILDRFSKM